MTSSTVPSRLRALLTLGVIALFGFLVSHLVMERLSRSVEAQGAYLWGPEQWLQLFTPTSHVDRGRGRVLLTGASEAREGLLAEYFEEELPGFQAYTYGLSAGLLEDVVLSLEYLEAAYGPTAIPEKIVLGTSFRMVMNYTEWGPPIYQAIDLYSPFFSVDLQADPHRLVPKNVLQSLASRYRFAVHQGARYRRGIHANIHLALSHRSGKPDQRTWEALELLPAENHRNRSRDKQQYWDAVRAGKAWYWKLGSIRPSTRENTIRRDFANLLAIAGRHSANVYVVNLPEGPWTELFYEAGNYDEYLRILRDAIGETPFLNLRRFLQQDEFHDWAHPNRAGAVRVSERVVQFLVESDNAQKN